jgi:DNA-binding transcriptional regulator YiaG
MANFASALKEEITRLARKETRTDTGSLKKTSAQQRSDIAALKRRVSDLERQVATLAKKLSKGASTSPAEDMSAKIRYSAKSLISQRKRLGLSAAELGVLLDVSTQTIYNWEAGTTRPRDQQVAMIAALRGMGKREVAAKLAERPSA